MVVRGTLIALMLFFRLSQIVWKFEDANEQSFRGVLVITSFNSVFHYSRYFNISQKKSPLRVRPLKNGAKPFLTLLLALCGDIESNPGPSSQVCQQNRPTESSISNTQQKNALCPECVECLEKLNQAEESKRQEISDIKSILDIYRINDTQEIPPEHPSNYLTKFKNIQHHVICTTNRHLPYLIKAVHELTYDTLRLDDAYLVNWTDLENKDYNKDEIQIEINEKSSPSENTVQININILSATLSKAE